MIKSKIKILYLITGLNVGGAEVLLWKFLQKLDKKIFDPVVVSFIPIGKIGKKMREDGVRVMSLEMKKTLRDSDGAGAVLLRFLAVVFIELPKLVKIIRRESPDILHAHMFHANLLGRIVGRVCRVPVIISTIHNVNIGGKGRELLLRCTGWLGTRTVAISKMVGKSMLEKRVVDPKEVVVIDNGIDIERFAAGNNLNFKETCVLAELTENVPVLIAIGRIEEQKGYSYLIDALEILDQKGLNFYMLILGEGSRKKELESSVKQKGLDTKVRFLGNRDDVEKYLFLSDIFILSSLWEGLPLALLEAMASALIVVAANVGGISEVINDGDNGFLVVPKNSCQLAEKIEFALGLPEADRNLIKENARETVLRRFSLENMVEKYQKLYKELLARK